MAAMIPAMRAVASTSPFLAVPSRISASVSARMATMPSAIAVRDVTVLVRDIDHMRLAPLIEMGERGSWHCLAIVRAGAASPAPPSNCARRASTSAWRIRLSPTRNACAPAAASLTISAWVKMPLSLTACRPRGTSGISRSVTSMRGLEGLQVAVIDADQRRRQARARGPARPHCALRQHVHAPIIGRARQAPSPGSRRPPP